MCGSKTSLFLGLQSDFIIEARIGSFSPLQTSPLKEDLNLGVGGEGGVGGTDDLRPSVPYNSWSLSFFL